MQTAINHDAAMEKILSIPAVSALGIEIETLTDDIVKVRAPRNRKFDGVFDTFHGGMLMTIADTIACFLIIKRNGPDVRIATTDMNIRFLAPCTTDITAEARFIKAGRTLNTVEVDLFDANDVKVAVAQVCYIRVDQIKNGNGGK
jgi:uncharacterized protein (TIGR00369 family)